ncbi:hypothetical protein [Actinomyces sp. zg296]|uniref:hypothetical protein n=1 Tax=Actinomyces sp. zg296 TaxID=2609289 RepID=UPI0013583AA7|nr:hypothetical protein [Actinomyces sp. zg296]
MTVKDKRRRDEELARRLLAIAADPGASSAERDQAQARASMIMARLMIDELDLDQPDAEQITTRDMIITGGPTTASRALADALHRIACAAGAATYYRDNRRQTRQQGPGPHIVLCVVGYPSDLDRLMPLLSAAQAHAAVGWDAWRRANPRSVKPMKPATRRATRDGYTLGWGDAIAERVRAARAGAIQVRDQDATTNSTALVVRSREQRITDYLSTLRLTTGTASAVDYRAYHDGARDAQASGLGANEKGIRGHHHLLEGTTTS